jgi:hypothetical protein
MPRPRHLRNEAREVVFAAVRRPSDVELRLSVSIGLGDLIAKHCFEQRLVATATAAVQRPHSRTNAGGDKQRYDDK